MKYHTKTLMEYIKKADEKERRLFLDRMRKKNLEKINQYRKSTTGRKFYKSNNLCAMHG